MLTFVSPIVADAIATLQANLPAQIAAFNAEAGAPVQLTNPAAYVPWAQDPLGVLGFPVIEVSCGQGASGNFGIDDGQHVDFDHDVVCNVVVWHEGDRGELATTCELSAGLTRCVLECLLPAGAFGANVEIADPQDQTGPGRGVTWRLDALPADMSDDQREFKKWQVPVFIQFQLRTVERLAPA